jgi:mannan endo-1,4-beta-mannosidase
MKNHPFRKISPLFVLLPSCLIFNAPCDEIGFNLKNGEILEYNGSLFIPRGINFSYAWQTGSLNSAIQGIASLGANCVRVGLSNGSRWSKTNSSTVQSIISLCKTNKLITVLEIHDCTGYSEQSGSVPLSTAVSYWIEIKSALIGQEKNVIINIANEPFGNTATVNDWINQHISAIKSLRNAGLKHLLVCDAANWGQDWEGATKSSALTVMNGDTLKNTMMSVHMYDVYKDDATVNAYMKAFVDKHYPLLVGEFASDHGPSKPVAAQAILDRAKQYGIGYIGWSWCGNSPAELAGLDISKSCGSTSLSTWGNLLVNGTNGLKSTSILASVYTGKIILPTKTCIRVLEENQRKMKVAIKGPHIQISIPALAKDIALLTIYAMNGKRIERFNWTPTLSGCPHFEIDAKGLPNGSYIARVSSDRTSLQAAFTVLK